jgi:hypothetical protein
MRGKSKKDCFEYKNYKTLKHFSNNSFQILLK